MIILYSNYSSEMAQIVENFLYRRLSLQKDIYSKYKSPYYLTISFKKKRGGGLVRYIKGFTELHMTCCYIHQSYPNLADQRNHLRNRSEKVRVGE